MAVNPRAAANVDKVTREDYGRDLRTNLEDVRHRVQRDDYRSRPSRRVCISKPGGRMRPLGTATLEAKIVQRAVVEVLNAVYEEDFPGYSLSPRCNVTGWNIVRRIHGLR